MDSILLGVISEEREQIPLRMYRKNLRAKFDPMDLRDAAFKKSFRLNKKAFEYVLNEVKGEMAPTVKSGLSQSDKLGACLRFFAEGSYQHGVGQDFEVAIAQPTFSKVLTEMLEIMEKNLCPKWICFEMTEEEKSQAKTSFYEKANFPGVVMCVDGTHVSIIPPKEHKNLYYNRKGFYSLNVLIVSDHQQRIRFVDSRHQGASHDSHIWRVREPRKFLEQQYRNGERCTWILGDAGYSLEPWLMTPFRSAAEGSRECLYNKMHSKTRNNVERTIGLLKNRFRCLLVARQLYYSPGKASQIVNVCCALHNICLKLQDAEFHELEEIESNELFEISEESSTTIQTEAQSIRNSILNSL